MKSKALHFLPLAFLAGTHGFALFAPYVALVLAALHLRSMSRERTRQRDRARERASAAAASLAIPAPIPDGMPAAALA